MSFEMLAVTLAAMALFLSLISVFYLIDRVRYWKNKAVFFQIVCEAYEQKLGYSNHNVTQL